MDDGDVLDYQQQPTFITTIDQATVSTGGALCGFTEECSAGRFALITAASFAASAGAAANLVLVYTLVFRKMPSTPPSIYPVVLAIFDALLCVFYVLLFGVDVAMIFLRIEVSTTEILINDHSNSAV